MIELLVVAIIIACFLFLLHRSEKRADTLIMRIKQLETLNKALNESSARVWNVIRKDPRFKVYASFDSSLGNPVVRYAIGLNGMEDEECIDYGYVVSVTTDWHGGVPELWGDASSERLIEMMLDDMASNINYTLSMKVVEEWEQDGKPPKS